MATLQPTDADVLEFVDSVGRNLPPLPYLETLRILNGGNANPLVDLLATRFSAQIRRLEINISLWKEDYSQLFPNLTELDILQCEDEDLSAIHTMEDVKKLLNSLEAPQLSKLHLSYPPASSDSNVPLLVEEELFRWLKQFPNMKYVDLGTQSEHLKTIENGSSLNPVTDSHSSLQFLSIQTSFEMSYDFLRCLPSLQILQLYVPSEPVVIDLSTNPAVKIKDEIQTGAIQQSNVREVLPRLRTVELCSPPGRETFTREAYTEYEQKKREGLTLENEDFPLLRYDIVKFLSRQVKRAKLYREQVEAEEVSEQPDSDAEEETRRSDLDEVKGDAEDLEEEEEQLETDTEVESDDEVEEEEENHN